MLNRPGTRAFVLIGVAVATGMLIAGPLDPPSGPVSSTYKTLNEVEPRIPINAANTPGDADSLFKITQPGSYYLTGNITGVSGKHGIEIAASGVTLDLMGFDLSGIPQMGDFDGVSIQTDGLTNITVRNGSIRGWGDEGVDLKFTTIGGCVTNVRSTDNTGNGITGGTAPVISGCTSSNNFGYGILIGHGGTIYGCSVYNCGSSGILTGDASTVTACTVRRGAADGFQSGNGCTITDCTAYENGNRGIAVFIGCTVSNCTVGRNTHDGVSMYSDCLIVGNNCSTNGNNGEGAGIRVLNGNNRVERNSCTGNDYGIQVDAAVNLVLGNSCRGNTGGNFVMVAGNRVGTIAVPPLSGVVSGNVGAAGMGTTDPWVNFAY